MACIFRSVKLVAYAMGMACRTSLFDDAAMNTYNEINATRGSNRFFSSKQKPKLTLKFIII